MRPANISKQRIMGQMKKLQQQKLSYLVAAPLEDDLYTWHFTFQGPENTQFHEGLYHGQILLPYEYPFKPPDIVFMNKNGRFETNTKICLTITQYHPQEWNSAWTVRTMLEAVISLFAENIQGVGSLTSTADVRKFLAKSSHSYACEKCGPIKDLLAPRPPPSSQPTLAQKITEPKLQEKIERKLSEQEKPVNQLLGIKRNYSEDQKNYVKQVYGSKVKNNTSSISRQTKQIPQIIEQPYEDDMFRPENSKRRIIYIQDRHPVSEQVFKLKQTVKTISLNLERMDRINKSLKWEG